MLHEVLDVNKRVHSLTVSRVRRRLKRAASHLADLFREMARRKMSGMTSLKGGSCLQTSFASEQRVRKRQPDGKSMGLGTSPG